MTLSRLDDVEFQIKKACKIYKHFPNPKPKQPQSSLLKIMPLESSESFCPFMPTPQEIDMADTVQFVWLSWVTPDERRLLWKRCEGAPWKILAYNEGLTIRQARYKFQKSLKKILENLIKNNKKQ